MADDKKNELLTLWEKYEDIAMHFSDLQFIRLRTQALAGLVRLSPHS